MEDKEMTMNRIDNGQERNNGGQRNDNEQGRKD
jgi:hypothetical protein